MSIKTTGKEFKAFYVDQIFWPKDWFHDDGIITIDGNEESDPMESSDNSVIIIDGGTVFKGGYDSGDVPMETHFKKWRKAQTVEYVTVEIPKGSSELLKEFIKTLK